MLKSLLGFGTHKHGTFTQNTFCVKKKNGRWRAVEWGIARFRKSLFVLKVELLELRFLKGCVNRETLERTV